MNKYIVAIHDLDLWDTWIVTFMARSFEDCERKLMSYLCDKYESLPEGIAYSDFLDELDKINVSISTIKDIEEL